MDQGRTGDSFGKKNVNVNIKFYWLYYKQKLNKHNFEWRYILYNSKSYSFFIDILIQLIRLLFVCTLQFASNDRWINKYTAPLLISSHLFAKILWSPIINELEKPNICPSLKAFSRHRFDQYSFFVLLYSHRL